MSLWYWFILINNFILQTILANSKDEVCSHSDLEDLKCSAAIMYTMMQTI